MENRDHQKTNNNGLRNFLGLLALLLGILLLLAGWWGYNLKNEKTGLIKDKDMLSSELDDMKDFKDSLQAEVASLERAYTNLTLENDSLTGSLYDANSRIASRDATIRKLKNTVTSTTQKGDSEASSLRAQIQSLLNVKASLESEMASIKMENDSLKAVTGTLTQDLSSAAEENRALAALNESIQQELKRLTLANFKASAFRVEVEKRRPKVTSKSRAARRINTSFDLTAVPEKYQGVRPIYLVISDEKANPITLINPIKARVKINGQDVDIIAAEQKEVNITSNQRLSFGHDLGKKLKRGFYRVAVYTDIGLLGATSMRLR